MSKDAAHDPELSSLRTYKKDIEGEHGVVLPNTPLTTPEEQVGLDHFHDQGDKQKHSFDVEGAFNGSHVQEGTIVTDKKKSRRSFKMLLKTAFNEWLDTTGKGVIEGGKRMSFLKPKTIPKVEIAEVRKSTIQEAAQYAKQAPRDDHAAVIEKIKTLAKDAEQKTGKPFILKQPAERKERVGYADTHESITKNEPVIKAPIEAPMATAPSSPIVRDFHQAKPSLAAYAVEDDRKSSPVASPVPELVVSPQVKTTEKKPPEVLPRQLLRPEQSSYETVPQERLDLRTAIAKPLPDEAPKEPEEQKEIHESPQAARWGVRELPHLKPIPAPLQERISAPPLSKTTLPAAPKPFVLPLPNPIPSRAPFINFFLLRKMLFIGVGVIGGSLVMYAVFLMINSVYEPETREDLPVLSIPSLIKADVQKPVSLSGSRTEFFEKMNSELSNAIEGITQLYPTKDAGEEGTVATAATADDILAVLAPQTSGVFLRNVKNPLTLGVIRTGEASPFFIFHISNFDAAFAGMLEWEPYISKDLSPLFGEVVTETLLLRENAPPSPPHFVDALSGNQSIRILYDGTQRERIVYAFTNNMLILTTTQKALTALIERVQ
jgi:hypothetical protein